MQVVITKDTPDVGRKGDIITVKPGYFLNYLGPQKIAHKATAASIKEAEKIREKAILKAKELKEKARELIEKIKGTEIIFEEKVSSKNKLYGSISEKDIISAIKEIHKIELEKENVLLDAHIKSIGEHKVKIKLDEDIETEIKVTVKESS